jgi:hypothetical protein
MYTLLSDLTLKIVRKFVLGLDDEHPFCVIQLVGTSLFSVNVGGRFGCKFIIGLLVQMFKYMNMRTECL